jgi:hypothetical protein
MSPEKVAAFDLAIRLMPLVAMIVAIGVTGWVITTWLRIKNGYPLDGKWGQALHPRRDAEAQERISLLTQENAQLRAEVGAIKDRLITVERIVTDDGARLAREIDNLPLTRN